MGLMEVCSRVKHRSEFPELLALQPDEPEDRVVMASLWQALRPLTRTAPSLTVRLRSARGVEAMSLRLRRNAHCYLRMLQD